MNERIQKLAEQAEQFADDTMNADPAKYDTPGQVKVWRELMQEKFAELIVWECAELCDINDKEQGDILREHFGVEE